MLHKPLFRWVVAVDSIIDFIRQVDLLELREVNMTISIQIVLIYDKVDFLLSGLDA